MKLEKLPTGRDCLYGPSRISANPAIKDLLTKDNIKRECKANRHDGTTNSACFDKKAVQLDRVTAKLGTKIQRTSNFEFGSCSQCPLTTTTSWEFCTKVLPPVGYNKIYSSHGTTSIPDFSPSLTSGKKIGGNGSVYSSSYYLQTRISPKSATKRKNNLKKQTKDMQSTHFNLGTNKDRNSTETNHSYHSRKQVNTAITIARSTATPCIFRKGDWNMTGSSTNKISVSHRDCDDDKKASLEPSLPRLVNLAVPQPYNSSVLRNDHQSFICSSYQKDFLKFDMTERHLKPIQEGRPKSSKILVQTPDLVYPESTKESDFVYRKNEAKGLQKKQMEEFLHNQRQQKMSCVVIADNDEENTKNEKQISLTFKDYGKPSDEILRNHKLRGRPSPIYDYIRIDKGLVDQPQQYPLKRLNKRPLSPTTVASSRGVCGKRLEDSYKSNVSLGMDNPSTMQSEQHGQFTVKTPMDPDYPAAGCSEQVVNVKHHIYAREDISSKESIEQPSLMKADYNPISERRFSSPQRRLLANSLKYPPKIAVSHYFHLDHTNKPKKSTTANDYIPPELLVGKPEIIVE